MEMGVWTRKVGGSNEGTGWKEERHEVGVRRESFGEWVGPRVDRVEIGQERPRVDARVDRRVDRGGWDGQHVDWVDIGNRMDSMKDSMMARISPG